MNVKIINENLNKFYQNDCESLKKLILLFTPENINKYLTFVPPIENIEDLSDDDKFILLLSSFADKIISDGKCLESLNSVISVIAKYSKENLAECLIDENQKIFTSLKKVLILYKKLNSLNIKDILIRNNFIKYLIDKAHFNLEQQLNILDDADEKKEIQDSFTKNINEIINLIFSENITQSTIPTSISIDEKEIISKIIYALEEKLNKININIPEIKLDDNILTPINTNFKMIEDLIKKNNDDLKEFLEKSLKTQEEFIKNSIKEIGDMLNSFLENLKTQISDLARLDTTLENVNMQIGELHKKIDILNDSIKKSEKEFNELQKKYLDNN